MRFSSLVRSGRVYHTHGLPQRFSRHLASNSTASMQEAAAVTLPASTASRVNVSDLGTDIQLVPVYTAEVLEPCDTFLRRHIGTTKSAETAQMLQVAGGFSSFDDLVESTIPRSILARDKYNYRPARTETEALSRLQQHARKNVLLKSMIGMGYYNTKTPLVVKRNLFENPAWYTAYTPYQAEISQGRLQMLLNFQTLVCDLTGMDISNASLLDEASAAAEAISLAVSTVKGNRKMMYVADDCHPQTIDVVRTRASDLNVNVVVGPPSDAARTVAENPGKYAGVLLQYPNTYGQLDAVDYDETAETVHADGGLVIAAADLMSLTLIRTPKAWGADVVVGSAQRFGVPMGYGGPHAAYLATREEFKRRMPGRVIGVSRDSRGSPALRMAMQTREQHIRRDKATSNICTAQALLANAAAAYAIYHGPQGLTRIAEGIHAKTATLARMLSSIHADSLSVQPVPIIEQGGSFPGNGLFRVVNRPGEFFDTLRINIAPEHPSRINADTALEFAVRAGYNFRRIDEFSVGISIDEETTADDIGRIAQVFHAIARYAENRVAAQSGSSEEENAGSDFDFETESEASDEEAIASFDAAQWVQLASGISDQHKRSPTEPFLTHEVFNRYHNETAMLRYLTTLANRDLSLAQAMIPLGSCTMKLNATAEMEPILWPEFANMHPFVPSWQSEGYSTMIDEVCTWLADVTGFAAVSAQPNSGAQGEYSGLRCIRKYLDSKGEGHRDICLIPASAHGTNPASAVLAGMRVVVVKNDPETGVIDANDFKMKLEKHRDHLAALMVTYPSTYGVFEDGIKEVVDSIHEAGGLVYMDGANMNAQCGLTSPGYIGADVCHLNLHKTFCIPHGGGGPGVGAIGVAAHLAPHLPGHSVISVGGNGAGVVPKQEGAVAAAPFGSAMILPITWMYLEMLGSNGLQRATETAILSANYLAKRLSEHYRIAFTGKNGMVAHEFIVDLRPFKTSAGITEEDVAKRLIDYGFHAPTMSWPIPGTLMIEPTESEDKAELDRFVEAMISIRQEIAAIERGERPQDNNVLKNAPHTSESVSDDVWDHPYTRAEAAFPLPWVRERKFWPSVGRIDNVFGDRHLICSCPPLSAYETMSTSGAVADAEAAKEANQQHTNV